MRTLIQIIIFPNIVLCYCDKVARLCKVFHEQCECDGKKVFRACLRIYILRILKDLALYIRVQWSNDV